MAFEILLMTLINFKSYFMSNITYIFATIFLLAWAAGFFIFGVGSSIHLVLVFALMLFLLRIVAGKSVTED
jgi:hypothetical protein